MLPFQISVKLETDNPVLAEHIITMAVDCKVYFT